MEARPPGDATSSKAHPPGYDQGEEPPLLTGADV